MKESDQFLQDVSKGLDKQFLSIDIAKLLSMFGVVYIHSDGYMSTYFRFGVPLLISISFFLAERKFAKDKIQMASFFKKRIPRLAIPFFIWSLFYFIINHQSHYESFLKVITKHWTGFGWSGQYYLIVLLSLTLLYPWLRRSQVTSSLILFISFFTIICFYIPFNYLAVSSIVRKLGPVPFFYWLFYFYLGIYAARKYDEIQIALAPIKPVYKIIALAFIPFLMIFEDTYVSSIEIAQDSYFRFSTIIVSALVFFLFLSLEDWLKSQLQSFKYILSWLSSWSLGIYCLNPFFIGLLNKKLVHSNDFIPASLFLSTFNSLLLCIACLIVSYLIFKFKGGLLVK